METNLENLENGKDVYDHDEKEEDDAVAAAADNQRTVRAPTAAVPELV